MAALAGDPARASMLNALMDGRALTASELASVSGTSPQTASGHLGCLVQAELFSVERQGPPPLSPTGLSGGRTDDREHHAGGGREERSGRAENLFRAEGRGFA